MDFYMTPYVAEFVNTLTNLGYIYLGVRGIKNSRRGGNDSVVNLCYSMLVFLGAGSAAYHLNIKHETQMLDEVSMLFTTISILYGAFSITLGSDARIALATLLTGVALLISVNHVVVGDVERFRLWFLFLVLGTFAQCVWLLSAKVPNIKVKREAQQLATYGTVAFVTAFILWNIDNEFCDELTSFRNGLGIPWGFVTELHGWWHLLTGLAVYYYIVFVERLRLYIKSTTAKRSGAIQAKLVWSGALTLPQIEMSAKED